MNFKQQFLAFTAISGLYTGVLALAFPVQFTKYNLLSIGIAFVIFLLSALITTSSAAKSGEENVQKFMLATTVQMLIALFYVLIARYTAEAHFRGMSIHFLILFFCFLIAQAFFLVRRVRKA